MECDWKVLVFYNLFSTLPSIIILLVNLRLAKKATELHDKMYRHEMGILTQTALDGWEERTGQPK